ncbi:MAG: amidohydrolase family protein [Parvibaculum sp.]|uniref:amidohydrolase family protein n=1 Tax=Parvibaculum sp. TaxID=2024848 RepID=UPI0032EE66CF
MAKLIIKGGRVLTMTDGAGEQRADVLVEDGKIADIAPDISADAEVIDATDAIVIPGFVDTHRHVWQTQLRTVATDWSLFDYFVEMRLSYSTFYTAEDAYLGNYVGALEALDAGITTLVDHCHILNTPEHAEEAARGLQDSGMRAIFCYGTFPNEPRVPMQVPDDPDWRHKTARELKAHRLSDSRGLVRFGFAPSEAEAMPFEDLAAEIKLARELGAGAISLHAAMGSYAFDAHVVENLKKEGLLGPDLLFVHGSAFTDLELDLIREAGAGISATPETELQMGMGFPVAHRAHAHGVRTGLGIDIVSNYSGDMFLPMRLALQSTRALRNAEYEARKRAPSVIEPKAESVLRMATIGGAEAINMQKEIGTLEKGKSADIAIISTGAIHMTPSFDAVGALVMNARPSDISTVLVNGKIVKRDGKLVGVDWPSLRSRFAASANRIMDGFRTVDIPATTEATRPIIPHLE